METAVFRFEAGPTVGLGHAIRCLALAELLLNDGVACRLVAGPATAKAVAPWMPPGLAVTASTQADDPQAIRDLQPDGCDLLVLDHYGLDHRFESALEGWARRRLVFEDQPSRRHDCEILVDQTYGRAAADYAGLVPGGAKLILGPYYAPLRPAFAEMRMASLQRRFAGPPLREVFLALGGTTRAETMQALLTGLTMARLPLVVHTVGPAASTATEGPAIRHHASTPDVVGLMAACDLAIGAGGHSSWERCCLGMPSLVVEIADNQRDVIGGLLSSGAVLSVGQGPVPDPASVAAAVSSLATDEMMRVEMSRRAARLCDGLGARRLLGEIRPVLDARGREVTLCPASFDDAELLFRWQTTPELRRFAHDPSPPSWDRHRQWLGHRLRDPLAGPFNVIKVDSDAAGMLRLDIVDPEAIGTSGEPAYLVSILVAPDHQGYSVASAALAAGRRLVGRGPIYAEVLPGNDPSHRLFRRAGYQQIRPGLYLLDGCSSGVS